MSDACLERYYSGWGAAGWGADESSVGTLGWLEPVKGGVHGHESSAWTAATFPHIAVLVVMSDEDGDPHTGVPEPSPWDSVLGPVLRGQGAAARLGLSESDLAELVARRGLLELRTADDFAVYPVVQFDGHQVVRDLGEVLAIFEPLAVTPWTLAGWFVTRSEDLGGLSPMDVLRSAGLTEALRRYAWGTSCAFAQ